MRVRVCVRLCLCRRFCLGRVYYWCTRTDETSWEPPSVTRMAPLDTQTLDTADRDVTDPLPRAASSLAHQVVESTEGSSSVTCELSKAALSGNRSSDADSSSCESRSATTSFGQQHENPFASGSSAIFPTYAPRYPPVARRAHQPTLIPLGYPATGEERTEPASSNPFSAAVKVPMAVAAVAEDVRALHAASDIGIKHDEGTDCEDDEDDNSDGDEGCAAQAGEQDCGCSSEQTCTKTGSASPEVTSERPGSEPRIFGRVVNRAPSTQRQYPRSPGDIGDWEPPQDLEPASCATRMDFQVDGRVSFEDNQELLLRTKKLRDVQREIAALRAELGMSQTS